MPPFQRKGYMYKSKATGALREKPNDAIVPEKRVNNTAEAMAELVEEKGFSQAKH